MRVSMFRGWAHPLSLVDVFVEVVALAEAFFGGDLAEADIIFASSGYLSQGARKSL
jgi:hypothetical protein